MSDKKLEISAFSDGVVEFGNRLAPGLGIFIEQCVRRAMGERGLEHQAPRQPRKRTSKGRIDAAAGGI
jgi:hypothetical protein